MTVTSNSLEVTEELVELIGSLGGIQCLRRPKESSTSFWRWAKASNVAGCGKNVSNTKSVGSQLCQHIECKLPVKGRFVYPHRWELDHHCSISAVSFIKRSYSSVVDISVCGGKLRSPRLILALMVSVLLLECCCDCRDRVKLWNEEGIRTFLD